MKGLKVVFSKFLFWCYLTSLLVFFDIFQGQFNYVNIVIKPLDYESNAITLQAKEGKFRHFNFHL